MAITITIEKKTPHRAKVVGLSERGVKAMDRHLSFPIEGAFFMRRSRSWHFDGRKHLFSKTTGGFPVGLLPLALEVLKKRRAKYTIRDERTWMTPLPVKPDMLTGITLAKHQLEAIESGLKNRGGIFHVATNGGKTAIGCALIKALPSKRVLWVVPSRPLLTQTMEQITKRTGHVVGKIGGGKFEPHMTTVATAASLIVRGKNAVAKLKIKRMSAYLKSLDMLILDEVHHLGSTQWHRPLSNSPAQWRFGLSGTPLNRSDGKNMMVEAVCGPVVARVTNEHLIKIGWSAKPTIELHEIDKPDLDPGLSWQEAYKAGIVNNSFRNEIIARRTLKATHDQQPTMILCQEIEHVHTIGDYLEALGFKSTDYVKCFAGTSQLQEKVNRFATGVAQVMIASPMFGEGVDLPGDQIRVLVNAGGYQSTILTLQHIGRGLRKKTGINELRMVEFADLCHKHLARHSMKRIADYEAENFNIITA